MPVPKEYKTKLVIRVEIFESLMEGHALENPISIDSSCFFPSLFSSFIFGGGYPAIISQITQKENILQSYYESMIFKDIVERYQIEDVKKLKSIANLLFESVSKEISYNKIANKLISIGFKISKNTIIEYLSYFEEAYLFFQNLKYEYSFSKQLGSIKKIYCIDNGLLNAVSFKFSKDEGKLIELF